MAFKPDIHDTSGLLDAEQQQQKHVIYILQLELEHAPIQTPSTSLKNV